MIRDRGNQMARTEAEAMRWLEQRFAELPVAALLDASPLACDAGKGEVTIACTARPDFCNLLGWVQGGMLTAMLDIAMSYAVLVSLPDEQLIPSLEIKTTYIAPARPGRLLATGSTLRKGSSIAFMEGRLQDAGGALLATASATGQLRKRG
ncbi:MAG: hypothetical protein C5B56_14030 [Proteobacteria bacterium]|nr:MAG: hypothetical protein C5B56_14030 [Pseudomonadota bacterium]